ncbi:glyceraldehyde-3-phosphate dehydrogenase 1 [Hanseniaspora osmophila]
MSDIEKTKQNYDVNVEQNTSLYEHTSTSSFVDGPDPNKSGWENFKDSFKRVHVEDLDPNLTAAERIAIKTARSPLKRKLKTRHIQMIAIGGAIGTGLFVGSGSSLRAAGPAGLLIGYFISATFILCVISALGELAVEFPVSGGFTTYATRFVDESFGFAANWNYLMGGLAVLPLEIVSASITVNFWGTPKKYRDGFVALFWVVIVTINMFGVKGYGEAEFLFSAIKVTCVLGFIILGIVLVCGGGPNGHYMGGTMWHHPYGAFVGDNGVQRFKSTMSVFVSAAFAYSGVEMVGLAAAETANPRKSLPRAAKQVFWRIALFYIVALSLVGLLVSHKDPRLIGTSSADAAASPFVIAIKSHGISGLPSVVNVVICIAVLSVGNADIFATSRILVALTEMGHIPRWCNFDYIDRQGRPLIALIVTSLFGCIAFVAESNKEGEVFDWLMALSGLSALFTWFGISLCHIRFRRALTAQGRSTDELCFKSPTGICGSYYSCFIIFLVICATIWTSSAPSGFKEMTSNELASNWFEDLLSLPIFLVWYFGHKIYSKSFKIFIPASKIDIDTGRRETDREVLLMEIAEEKAALAQKNFLVRAYFFWC